jgi:hypothetical protein
MQNTQKWEQRNPVMYDSRPAGRICQAEANLSPAGVSAHI